MVPKHILVVDDEDSITELISKLLSDKEKFSLKIANSGNEAKAHIEHDDVTYSLVISDYRMADGNGKELYEFVRENHPAISFILTSVMKPAEIEGLENFIFDRPNNNFIEKSALTNKLKLVTDEILTAPGWQRAGLQRLSIEHFDASNYSESDIFVQLSEEKFVKVAHSTEQTKSEILSKFTKRDVTHVFIQHNNYKEMLKVELYNLEDKLKATLGHEVKEVVEAQTFAAETIHECLRIMGLSADKFRPIMELVNSCIGSYEGGIGFSELFANLSTKENPQAKLCILVSYLAVGIASKYKSEIEFPVQPIVMAAILQDIYIPEDSTLITDLNSSDFKKHNAKEQELIEMHTYLAAKLLHSQSAKTQIVEELIQNHHERPGGKGFPEKKKMNALSPLTIIYIIANDFATRLLKVKLTKQSMDNLFLVMEEEYSRGTTIKCYEAFLRLFNKKVPGEDKRVF